MDELREAIAWLTPFDEDIILTPDHIKAITVLLTLAQSYLNLSGKVPGEKLFTYNKTDSPDINLHYDGYVKGFNQARHETLLAITGLLGEEKLLGLAAQGYCTKRNENKILDADLLKDIASAIRLGVIGEGK